MSRLDDIRRDFFDEFKVLESKNIYLFRCAILTCLSSVTLYDFNTDKSMIITIEISPAPYAVYR